MNVKTATKSYEAWLALQITLIEKDLALKHRRMAADPFSFLRATFYRWVELWPAVCSDLASAPLVLSVGDLHVENFGTWRDSEGRLIWGINDFDEAHKMAYTNELVRLAASAHLAITMNHLTIKVGEACDAILKGYQEGLKGGGRPFVLAEEHRRLRDMVNTRQRNPAKFWKKMDALATVKSVPDSAMQSLKAMLPEPDLPFRVAHRISGLGSLGRQRYVALGEWLGGKIAAEAKSLATSACVWPSGKTGKNFYQIIIDTAVRCPDPAVRAGSEWLVRRLAPDCNRIELSLLPKDRDEHHLLEAMGAETANIHLGNKKAAAEIKADLKRRKAKWLHNAAKAMVQATMRDWKDWKK
jgi:uncharacterized protein (DUF2252 family)